MGVRRRERVLLAHSSPREKNEHSREEGPNFPRPRRNDTKKRKETAKKPGSKHQRKKKEDDCYLPDNKPEPQFQKKRKKLVSESRRRNKKIKCKNPGSGYNLNTQAADVRNRKMSKDHKKKQERGKKKIN